MGDTDGERSTDPTFRLAGDPSRTRGAARGTWLELGTGAWLELRRAAWLELRRGAWLELGNGACLELDGVA